MSYSNQNIIHLCKIDINFESNVKNQRHKKLISDLYNILFNDLSISHHNSLETVFNLYHQKRRTVIALQQLFSS